MSNEDKVQSMLFGERQEGLPTLFKDFVGAVITTKEREYNLRGREYKCREPDEKGREKLSEIYNTAKENNVQLRVWTPSSMGTMDVVPLRLNLHVGEQEDGSWIVEDHHYYG